MKSYVFTSERLGFRNWLLEDLDDFTAMNNDDEVMEYFPNTYTKEQCRGFIGRMQEQYKATGFCYFAVDIKETQEFIGFIGLSEQSYLPKPASFVDIGWRLKRSTWNHGYATEGAKACIEYGFSDLALEEIYAVASEINTKSEKVMQKIGMRKLKTFEHPNLNNDKNLKSCVLYVISRRN